MIAYVGRIKQINSRFNSKLSIILAKQTRTNTKVYVESCRSIFRNKFSLMISFSWTILNQGPNEKNVIKNSELEWRKERMVSHYIALAEAAIKDGDMDKAETILVKALDVSGSIKTIGVTCVYDMLATIAYRTGDTAKATRLLEEVITKLSSSNDKEDNNLVNFSLKLARIYEKEGKTDLAEFGFRNCVAVQKSKYLRGAQDEETTTLWINSLFWYGKFLVQMKRYFEAKQCFNSAYVLVPHVKSLSNEQAMVMLYNLGEMSFATGDSEGALKHLLNAVLLGKSLNSQDLPLYYNRIGLIYMHQGIYNEAMRWCSSGLETSKKYRNKATTNEAQTCLKEIQKVFTGSRGKI